MTSLTTADTTADYLRDGIIAGDFAPGAPINQNAIAVALGVSRSPVRDAIQLLATEHLVVTRANATATVAPLGLDDLQELYELRMALEPSLCRLALPHLNRVTLLQMEEQLELMEKAKDNVTWVTVNDRFHAKLYRQAARPRMVEIVDRSRQQTGRYTRMLITQLGTEASNQQHRQIFGAAEQGNGPELEALVLDHLGSACDLIMKLMYDTHRPEAMSDETGR